MGKRRLCRRLTYQAIISLQFNSGYCPCENVYGLLGLFGAIPDKSAPPPLMLLATALCANSFPLASRPDQDPLASRALGDISTMTTTLQYTRSNLAPDSFFASSLPKLFYDCLGEL